METGLHIQVREASLIKQRSKSVKNYTLSSPTVQVRSLDVNLISKLYLAGTLGQTYF